MPKVSIIMPVYNGERFIRDAVESVLAQTWRDWELIIVDDGSTDRTMDCIRPIADTRIRVMQQQRRGVSLARNNALDSARGKYLAFLDADDLYESNALADLVGFLEETPGVDVAISNGCFCDAEGKRLMSYASHRPCVRTGNILEALILDPTLVGAIDSTLVRRCTIERGQARFDPQLAYCEDWDFWIRIAQHARFGYVDKPTFLYRMHSSGSTVSLKETRRRHDVLLVCMKVLGSPFFLELPEPVRFQFVKKLLVGHLTMDPLHQQLLMTSPHFAQLARQNQAHLLRLVAADYLRQRRETAFAHGCLLEANTVWPGDQKSRFILALMEHSILLASVTLLLWQRVHGILTCLRDIRTRRAVPAPYPPEKTAGRG